MNDSYSNTIRSFVTGKIARIRALPDAPRKRLLAMLRREAGNAANPTASIHPEVWAEVFAGSPDEFHRSHDGQMTKEERAVLIAMTLYACVPTEANESGLSFGAEMARYAPTMEYKHRAGGRFYPVLAARDVCEAALHIRRCLILVNSKTGGTRIDYGTLARDLYLLQCGEDKATGVRLRWNREFARIAPKNDCVGTTAILT